MPPDSDGQSNSEFDARGDPAAFVRANTAVESPPLIPEIRLHLANEVVPIWEASEAALAEKDLPPPFWAFAWAGGQALARYVLDRPELVAGRRVLDFAAGSGIQGIAAAKAGARAVTASEIDPFAATAIHLNAALNQVRVEVEPRDLLDEKAASWDVVLAGDVCYERPMAERVAHWLARLAAGGTLVLLGDPGRNFLPREVLEPQTTYRVETGRELEDSDWRDTTVWRMRRASAGFAGVVLSPPVARGCLVSPSSRPLPKTAPGVN
ncbi:MAG: 50S ribosomal protein L11 methyltransferase [Proteobacteria bacterium]|nr:50S ribosomal protein L11 methyltransferase [Pseudomonadota bacterium]